jgi:hypothetical protein
MLIITLIVLHLQPLLTQCDLLRQEHTKNRNSIIGSEPVVLAEEGMIKSIVTCDNIKLIFIL